MEEDRTVLLTFANVWNLLNMIRAVGSGYSVQLHGDVTFKASKAALNKHLQNPSPAGTDWTLEEALGCCESFYVLEALPQKWSNMHLCKCKCPECFKSASCMHVLLAGMVCDP